jgi:hypothetical protein
MCGIRSEPALPVVVAVRTPLSNVIIGGSAFMLACVDQAAGWCDYVTHNQFPVGCFLQTNMLVNMPPGGKIFTVGQCII